MLVSQSFLTILSMSSDKNIESESKSFNVDFPAQVSRDVKIGGAIQGANISTGNGNNIDIAYIGGDSNKVRITRNESLEEDFEGFLDFIQHHSGVDISSSQQLSSDDVKAALYDFYENFISDVASRNSNPDYENLLAIIEYISSSVKRDVCGELIYSLIDWIRVFPGESGSVKKCYISVLKRTYMLDA